MKSRMRRGVLVSVAVVALLAIMPLTALACHVEEYSGQANCYGFQLHADIDGYVQLFWTASYERLVDPVNDVWQVEDTHSNPPGGETAFGPSWDFPATPPANANDGLWQTQPPLPDGVYRAVLSMWADDGSTYEETVLGIVMPCSPPSAVTLALFDASAAGQAIELKWETASELNSLGFNVFRAESADGLRTMLNSGLIASQAAGSPMGASYEFVDDTASAGVTYYYWLQEVDANSETVEYGPVSAQLEVLRRLRLARPRLAPWGAFSLTAD